MHTTQECRIGDARKLLGEMPGESVDTIITSPPYWGLRDYGVEGQIGLEPTLEEYHARLLEVTAGCMRVLKPTGVMFWNHGDSYGGSGGSGGDYAEGGLREGQPKVGKFPNTIQKCMTMQNERLIIRMIDEQGWILRNRVIWAKPNGMPSSVQDRFSNKYEPVYMLVKSHDPNYYYNPKTGVMQRDKPLGTKGDEGVDWDWKEVGGGQSERSRKKVSNWVGRDYWFDLDAVRVPHTWIDKERKKTVPTSPRKKFDNKMGGGGSGFNGHSGSYKSDGTPLNHPLGKNPGDVCELTQVGWMNYCRDLYDMFADEHGDIIRIPTQPYSESHFATFPMALIEPMIKVACPAEICPVCGLARERIVDREFVPQQDVSLERGIKGAKGQKPMDKSNKWEGVPRGTTTYHTTGWTSCSCNAGWIAGTVLDPFCGSGTVLAECRLLYRNGIGLELNPKYEPMIIERSMSHTPPLSSYFTDAELRAGDAK